MQIMKNWRGQRFVILTGIVSDIAVLLSDSIFWANNADKLEQWCKENNCKQEGMTVIFPNEKMLSMFCLRWS